MKTFNKLFTRLIEHHGEEADHDPKTKKIYDSSLGDFLTKITDSHPLYASIEKQVREMADSETDKDNSDMEETSESVQKKKKISGNQSKIDVAEPYGEITAADFKKLRSKKDNKDEEITEADENKKSVRFNIKKNESGEYVVKVFIDGKYDDNKSYFTDDKQDALDTLKAMKQEYRDKGYILTEARKKYGKVNPWAVCTAKVGRDDKKKYERCVKDVKKSHVIDRG